MKKYFAWALALAVLLQFGPKAAGILDTTFNPGAGADGIVEQVLPLADGRILICGNFTTFNGQSRPYIARLNSDGSLDHSFFGQASYWVRHMSAQADGKIVIGGFFKGVQGVPRSLIARLNSDGSLDTSFDPGSGCTISLGTAIDGNVDPFVFWTEVQPDGKILVTGNFRNYNGASSTGIVRLNPNGSRDTSFNVGGGLDSWGRHIEVLPNGQILLSGWFTSYNGRSFNRLARIHSDGSPDTTFNPFFGDKTAIYSTARLANNKYVVSGHSLNEQGLFKRAMARLNADGSVDSSFVGYTNEKTESVAVQSDGKIIIGGYFNNVNGTTRTAVARMFADGTLDNSWGANVDNYVWTVALDRDGKLMISGGFTTVDGASRGGVARLLTGVSGGVPNPEPEPQPQPVAPVLSVTGVSEARVTLLWSDSAPNRGYYILQRKTGADGTFGGIARFVKRIRGCVDPRITPGTQYFYRIRATTTAGETVYSNEVMATVPGGGPVTPSAVVFIGSDATRGGSWKDVYGSEGYNVFGDVVSYPSYASVTVFGKTDWLWTAGTGDQRALQKVNSFRDRIAACWYSSTSFTIDLRITDGATHRVAIYMCDWDSSGRAQTIDVLNGATGAVLNTQSVSGFSSGRFLIWDVKGHAQFRVTRTGGPNAIVNGIFFGPAGAQL